MNIKQRVSAQRGRASLPFWLSTSRLRSNFVAADLPATEDLVQQAGNPGNVEKIERGVGMPQRRGQQGRVGRRRIYDELNRYFDIAT
jgi:hypothetical protein